MKARAAKDGRTLSEYLRRELVALAERPTQAEVWERIRSRPMIEPRVSPTELVRRERDAREGRALR